jgi:hypothetical protein
MNLIDKFLRLLDSIVDTVPSACVLLSLGYGGGTANENN